MKILKWLFDGPRIRGLMLKRLAELERLLPGLEEQKESCFFGMFMQDYEYTRGKIEQTISEIKYLKSALNIEF
jgi:hypothetical protein